MKQNRLTVIGISLIGILGTALFYMDKPIIWQFGILALYIAIFFWMLARQWEHLRWQWGKGVLSLILSLGWIYSSHGRAIHTFHWTTWILALVACVTIGFTFYLSITELEHPFEQRSGPIRRIWALVYAIIPFAVWFCYFMVYYPGKMTYDSFWQWAQAHQITPYNNWHPILHTWIIQVVTHLWNSPAAFALLQMIVLSCVISYAMMTLRRLGMPLGMVLFIDLVYAIDPVNGFYVITLWKDILFATMVLLFTVLLAQVYQSQGAWLKKTPNIIFFGVVAFLVMNLRDNGPEVGIAALVLGIALLRGVRIRMTIVSAIVIVLYFVFTGPVFQAAHVIKNPLNQALAIPTQQVAATYADHGHFTPELKSYFDSILPASHWVKDYTPYTVNPIKQDHAYNQKVIEASFSTYLKNWAGLLARNPVTFVEAYLNQVATIWQFHSVPGVRPYFDTSLQLQQYPIGLRMMAPTSAYSDPLNQVIQVSYQAYVKSMHEHFPGVAVASYQTYEARALRDIHPLTTRPLLSSHAVQHLFEDFLGGTGHVWANYFAKGAIPLFLLVVSLIGALRRFGGRALSVYTPPLFVIVTIAMGMPATDFRYCFSFVLSVPFLLFFGKLRFPENEDDGSKYRMMDKY